jgi:proteic killer suppression protein
MKISYANSRIRKICTNDKIANKELGKVEAKILQVQLERLAFVDNLEVLRYAPGHWHELTGDRWGQLAGNIGAKMRLIFEPDHDPRPEKPDGGLDWFSVTSVMIIEIIDYHD